MKVISVIHDEFKTIAGSYAILLVLMGGIFVYGLLYNYMYAPDLVRKVPVAVVDHSHSELSRHYVRLLDATPAGQCRDYGYRLSGSPGYDEVGQGGWYSLSAG